MKNKPTQKILEQYIYDYGFEKSLQLLHLNKESANRILNWNPKNIHYAYNTVIDKKLGKNSDWISTTLAANYEKLYKHFVGNRKTKLTLSQTDEDNFHTAFIQCLETGLDIKDEALLLNLFKLKYLTIKKYNKIKNYSMSAAVMPLEIEVNGIALIPCENNAFLNQTKKK